MKTAISLPDTVFREAERFARHAKKSRSKLYADALAEYLARHSPDEITESLNQVAAKINGKELQFAKQAARTLVAREAW
jgi:predicted transcriptional regulator